MFYMTLVSFLSLQQAFPFSKDIPTGVEIKLFRRHFGVNSCGFTNGMLQSHDNYVCDNIKWIYQIKTLVARFRVLEFSGVNELSKS